MATQEELRLRGIIIELLDKLESSLRCDAGDMGKESFDAMMVEEYSEFQNEYNTRENPTWEPETK